MIAAGQHERDFRRQVKVHPLGSMQDAEAVLAIPEIFDLVLPAPATHAMWTQLKAGEAVSDAFFVVCVLDTSSSIYRSISMRIAGSIP